MKTVTRATAVAWLAVVGLASWSVADLDGFWRALWDFFDVRASQPYQRVLADARTAGLTDA